MELLISLRSIFVAISVAFNALLIFLVYRNNPRSATNIVYGLLGLIISIWLVINFVTLHPAFLTTSLFWIRLSIFFAMPLSATFFLLAHTIPYDKLRLSKKALLGVFISTLVVMFINIYPYAYTGIEIRDGSPNPIPGQGLLPFAALSTLFSALAVYVLVKKLRNS